MHPAILTGAAPGEQRGSKPERHPVAIIIDDRASYIRGGG
jgi:hypothetical protein